MKFQTGVSKFQFKFAFSTSKFPIRVSKLGGGGGGARTVLTVKLCHFISIIFKCLCLCVTKKIRFLSKLSWCQMPELEGAIGYLKEYIFRPLILQNRTTSVKNNYGNSGFDLCRTFLVNK